MKKLIVSLAILLFFGVILLWASLHYVVMTKKGVMVINKRFVTLTDTFVDIQKWSSADFRSHSELSYAMYNQGYGDLEGEVDVQDLKGAMDAIPGKIEQTVKGWFGVKPKGVSDRLPLPDPGK